MADQTYTALARQSDLSEWRERVRLCIIHTAVNVKIKVAPTAQEAAADTLGRAVVLNPELWTKRFAPVVATILIGQPDLSEAQVADAELFSAVDASWSRFYDQPAIA